MTPEQLQAILARVTAGESISVDETMNAAAALAPTEDMPYAEYLTQVRASGLYKAPELMNAMKANGLIIRRVIANADGTTSHVVRRGGV